jgi:hypothetical protein
MRQLVVVAFQRVGRASFPENAGKSSIAYRMQFDVAGETIRSGSGLAATSSETGARSHI